MYRASKYLLVLCFLVALLSLPLIAAHAAPASGRLAQDAQPAQVDFTNLVDTLKNLVGVGALIAALVNAGKAIGLVKDGDAGTWSAGLNVLALFGLVVAQITGTSSLIPAIDTQAGGFASVLTVIIAFTVQLLSAQQAHKLILAGLPLIGTSNSDRMAGETVHTIESYVG